MEITINGKPTDLEIQEITLLSVEEAEALLTSDRSSLRWMTPDDLKRWCWLRTSGDTPTDETYYAAVLDHGNNVRLNGCDVGEDCGVRPAMRVSTQLTKGDVFEAGGESWTMLNNELAYCDRIVAQSRYRRDSGASDANDYEKSDIKKWLENWALKKGIYTTAQMEQMQGRA